jgi:hypothetical protein
MSKTLQLKRGIKANLPTLSVGEPAFTTDTNDFFVGNGINNIRFANQNDIDNINISISDLQQKQKTYDELKLIITNDKLVPGTQYVLTDYATKYQQPDTLAIKTMNIEKLVLTAISTNTFDIRCSSLTYPKDIIYYDFDMNVCEDNTTSRNGFIIRRKDKELNLDAPYDWRSITWARYTPDASQYLIGTTATNYSTWTSGAITLGIVYKYGNTLYMGDTSGTPTSTTDKNFFGIICDDITVGTLRANLKVSNNGTSDITLQKSSTLKEYLTFGSNCHDIVIDGKGGYLPNSIFGNNCYNITIEKGCLNNYIGNGCYNLAFGISCKNMTLASNCYNNTFGYNIDGFTMGNSSYSNIFAKDCKNLTFGANTYSNTFMGAVKNVSCGCVFSSNVFKNSIASSTFQTCTFANVFMGDCEQIVFKNGCCDNVFMAESYAITLGNNCEYNTFLNFTASNIFGDNKINITIKYMQNKNISNIANLTNKDYTNTIETNSSGAVVYWYLNSSNVPTYTTIT